MMASPEFISGMIAMGFTVCAVFFLRFWRRTRDSFFLVFSVAFLLLALNQALAILLELGREELGWVYLLRIAAFTLIIVGIVRKNV